MKLTEHYDGFKWVKVKRYTFDPNLSWEENWHNLDVHHVKETTFLVDEIRKLAAMIDERDKRIDELVKNQKDPWPPEEWAPH